MPFKTSNRTKFAPMLRTALWDDEQRNLIKKVVMHVILLKPY